MKYHWEKKNRRFLLAVYSGYLIRNIVKVANCGGGEKNNTFRLVLHIAIANSMSIFTAIKISIFVQRFRCVFDVVLMQIC